MEAVFTLAVLVSVTVTVYVISFVVPSPMLGWLGHRGVGGRRQAPHDVEQIPTSLGE